MSAYLRAHASVRPVSSCHPSPELCGIFSCVVRAGSLEADGIETLGARFWTEEEARNLPLASWLTAVLPLLFGPSSSEAWFEPPRWAPPSE
jgi:hypothetical protein